MLYDNVPVITYFWST